MKTKREEKSRGKKDGVSDPLEARLDISRNAENESTTLAGAARLGMRTLTISSLYRQWGGAHRTKECCVPSIRLNGKWLGALGLAPGQKIRVVTNGSIITIAPIAFDREIAHYAK
jgi:hypothetical protein